MFGPLGVDVVREIAFVEHPTTRRQVLSEPHQGSLTTLPKLREGEAGRSVGLVKFSLLAAVLASLAGCATSGRGPSMGCLDPLAADCKDPTAYPPLVALLPLWPFPSLLVPLPERTTP